MEFDDIFFVEFSQKDINGAVYRNGIEKDLFVHHFGQRQFLVDSNFVSTLKLAWLTAEHPATTLPPAATPCGAFSISTYWSNDIVRDNRKNDQFRIT